MGKITTRKERRQKRKEAADAINARLKEKGITTLVAASRGDKLVIQPLRFVDDEVEP